MGAIEKVNVPYPRARAVLNGLIVIFIYLIILYTFILTFYWKFSYIIFYFFINFYLLFPRCDTVVMDERPVNLYGAIRVLGKGLDFVIVLFDHCNI